MQLQRNEILTGLLVVGTVAVIVGVLILLGAPGLFRPLVIYKIYVDNAAGIKLGAPVMLAGRQIGQVHRLSSPVSREEDARAQEAAASIRPPDPNATPMPANSKPKFEVRIDVQVDKNALVYRDAQTRLMQLGLLGEMAMDITQGTEESGRAHDGEMFAGERTPDFSEAVSNMLEVGNGAKFKSHHRRKFGAQSSARAIQNFRRTSCQFNRAGRFAHAFA